jgi:ankyrin repeat protein
MYACEMMMPEVALKILEMNCTNPHQINKDGFSSLIYACNNEGIQDVVLKLLSIDSVRKQVSDIVLTYATASKMSEEIIKEITNIIEHR